MAVNKKNLRVCNILHKSKSYDVIIAVGDLDETDNILQDWALATIGETITLPQELIYCKDITEVLTSLTIDEFVYINSPVSAYMEMPRSAGISEDLPVFPSTLNIGGFYVVPTCLAFLWSEAGFKGYFGEYIIPESDPYTLTAGINHIGISFNSGAPMYTMHTDFNDFDFSSIIPVVTILNFGGEITVVPFGQTGYGLPEKEIKMANKKKPIDIIGNYTLTSASGNYVQLGQVLVNSGTEEILCPAVDTSVSNNDMYLFYKDSSQVWQSNKITTLNNTQYQGTGLQNLGVSEFVINNIFRVVDDGVTLIFNVLSGHFNSEQDAINSTDIVDVPSMFAHSAVHVGRMILEIGSTVPVIQTKQKSPWGIA